MSACRILVVDDEPQIRRVMRSLLTAEGYEVIEARDGEDGVQKWRAGNPDLILLDLNMPGLNGLEACRWVRKASEVPIIILSVRDSEKDKVEALDAGADDYMTKPFGSDELLARIRAARRRNQSATDSLPDVLRFEDLEINFPERRVVTRSGPVRLTRKEFDLLHCLVVNANKPISHKKLLQTVWGPDYGEELVYLRVFINQLRKKIEPDPASPRFIITEPCVGYRFSAGTEQPGLQN